MAVSFQLNVAGMPAPAALQEALQSVEVEENADSPDAMTLTLPVNRTASGDLTYVDDGTFEPYTPVSVVLRAGASASACSTATRCRGACTWTARRRTPRFASGRKTPRG